MPFPFLRRLLCAGCAVLAVSMPAPSLAQDTKVAFQLDWRFEGPAALFLLPKAKGYFAQEKLDVTVDAGNGSGNAVNRVASGTYQMGFADVASLIEETCEPAAVRRRGWVDPAAVQSLFEQRRNTTSTTLHYPRLWSLMILELWARAVFDRPAPSFSATESVIAIRP